jgi:hypothetical protein
LVHLADSKAQFILGANTVLITVIVVIFPEHIRNIFQKQEPFIVSIYVGLLTIFVVTTLVSMVLAFLVVLPRGIHFSANAPHAPLLYYQEIAKIFRNADEYNKLLMDASPQEILKDAGAEIYGISITANRKYDLLRLSIKWLIANVILWILISLGTLLFTP